MKLLSNSKVMLVLAIVVALIFPSPSSQLEILLVPALIVMMSLSMKQFSFELEGRCLVKKAARFVALNAFILPAFLIALSTLTSNENYRIGMVLLATVPPAIGVVPVTCLLRGNVQNSVIGEIAAYLFSLVWTPLLVYVFLGNYVSTWHVLKLLVLLILVPLLISRIIQPLNFKPRPWINCMYAFGMYEVVALNQGTIIQNFSSLAFLFAALALVRFGVSSMFYFLSPDVLPFKERIPYVLFSTMKNGGAATVFALLLFDSVEVLVPIAVYGILLPLFLVYFEFLSDHARKAKS